MSLPLQAAGIAGITHEHSKRSTRTDFYKFGQNWNGAEGSNVVSAKNETEAEFNILFRPKLKLKIINADGVVWEEEQFLSVLAEEITVPIGIDLPCRTKQLLTRPEVGNVSQRHQTELGHGHSQQKWMHSPC